MGKGSSSYGKTGWDRGFSMHGAFILDHSQPFAPLTFWKISNFFPFILGGQFLLPQRANNGEREFLQLQNWMRQRICYAWGLHPGPFAALCTSHFLKIFKLFPLHTGRPILITPESQLWGKGVPPTSKLNETEEFQCLGHSNCTISSPLPLSLY